jgi:hypothetical protein
LNETFRRLFRTRAPALLFLPFLLTACIDDPTGPSALSIRTVGASPDTMWIGAPGEPIPTGVAIRVSNVQNGEPVAGATVTWESFGPNGVVVHASAQSDAKGLATAVWQLGTSAGEQQLLVSVRSGQRTGELKLRALAVPHVVAQLRISVDSLTVVRLGDSLPISVTAVDPYGNVFAPPDPRLSSSDTTVGTVAGSVFLAGPRRGATELEIVSNYVNARIPLRVVQHVAAIVPQTTALRFTSLGAELPIRYAVLDDRGRVVADTTAALSVADTTVAQLSDTLVRASKTGSTELRFAVGTATTTIPVEVQQRIASLRLQPDSIRFDALRDTATFQPVAVDSLGFPVPNPDLVYELSDGQVVTLAGASLLEAAGPGVSLLTLRDPVTSASVMMPIVVQQRVSTIQVAPITFDALGDTLPIAAIAVDRLGSAVIGASLTYSISNPGIATIEPDGRLRSQADGHAVVTVSDLDNGTTGSAEVIVDQVATNLSVAVDYPSEVVRLWVGDILPLNCQATDRNNFPISRSPVFEGARRGTVTGTDCTDLFVTRGGYDSLSFAMNGVRTTIPVIVATAPDSVGVVAAAQPLPDEFRIRYVGEDLAHPSILALQPLVEDIFAAYGNPTDQLAKARAVRDWVARMAVHPHPPLHPGNSTRNRSVLPIGMSWADVNAITSSSLKFEEDRQYWSSVGWDGYAMLDRLLGKLDPATGVRAPDGMMELVGPAHYRIRDIKSYRYVLCLFQTIMVNALWAAAGLHSTMASTIGHDASAVFIPELNQWVYEDVTYNEEYLLDGTGTPMSPQALLAYTTSGEVARLRPLKFEGPDFDPVPYIPNVSYLSEHPEGIVIMGSQLNSRVVGIGGWSPKLVQIDVPRLALEPFYSRPTAYAPVKPDTAFPTLGVVISALMVEDSTYVVHLNSTFPNHQSFERRISGGAWTPTDSIDVLPVGECRVEYRSIDVLGNAGSVAVLDVWLPRVTGFTESGASGAPRRSTELCVKLTGW